MPPDELEEPKIPSRHLVMAPLPIKRKHLNGPSPDPGNRKQPPPATLVIGPMQIDAPPRNFAGGTHERARTRPTEIKRLQERGRNPGKGVRRRHITQRNPITPHTTWPKAPDEPTLDRSSPLKLDQLLADRPSKRLKRLGPAPNAQPEPATNRSPDQGIIAEARVKGTQVIVNPKREAHARNPILGCRACIGARPEEHGLRRGLRNTHDNRPALMVQETRKHAAAMAQHPIGPTMQRQAKRPERPDLPAQLRPAQLHAVAQLCSPLFKRWMSTSSERVLTICSASTRPPRERRSSRRRG